MSLHMNETVPKWNSGLIYHLDGGSSSLVSLSHFKIEDSK